MISEKNLIMLASAYAIGYLSLAFVLLGHSNNPYSIEERIKKTHAALFREISLIGQQYIEKKTQQNISVQLKSPQTQNAAIINLLQFELSSYISTVKNTDEHSLFTKQEQKEAFDASYNKIVNAIFAGEWRNEDSQKLMEYTNKIRPEKRKELLELYYGALNKNELKHNPNVLPPPF